MTFTKIDPADLDSPRRELSNGGLKSVVTLLVRWHVIFVGSYWTSNPAVGSFQMLEVSLRRFSCIVAVVLLVAFAVVRRGFPVVKLFNEEFGSRTRCIYRFRHWTCFVCFELVLFHRWGITAADSNSKYSSRRCYFISTPRQSRRRKSPTDPSQEKCDFFRLHIFLCFVIHMPTEGPLASGSCGAMMNKGTNRKTNGGTNENKQMMGQTNSDGRTTEQSNKGRRREHRRWFEDTVICGASGKSFQIC